MKIKKLLAIVPFLFVVTFCQPHTPVNPSVAPEVPQDTAWCGAGCAALQRLNGRDGKPGCEESRSINGPNGEIITCEQFCRETQEAGRNLYPSCWVKVKSCVEVEELRKRPYSCEIN